ncbi:MAG TPA: hypothetical protein VNH11_12450 [Pirellulales bacterium]|nr:hypothetical protein [Pirellulales bacterium]
MIADEARQDTIARHVSDALSDAKVLSAVMRRLAARSRLSQLATDTWRGIAAAEKFSTQLYVGETKVGNGCNNAVPPTVNFPCADADFTCGPPLFPNGFNCGQGGFGTFNCSDGSNFNCAGKGAYNCGGADGSQVYDCTTAVYDCSRFDCTTADGCGFQCSTELDYLCDGTFNCDVGFDCTSGHVFFCMTGNTCVQNFGCTATGATGCNNNPYNPPGNDGNPGDFLCGAGPNAVGANFQCVVYFTCNGSDDFDCNLNAQFNCGDAINNSGSFSCQTQGTFACDNQVNCSGQYSGCPSSTTQYSPPPPS